MNSVTHNEAIASHQNRFVFQNIVIDNVIQAVQEKFGAITCTIANTPRDAKEVIFVVSERIKLTLRPDNNDACNLLLSGFRDNIFAGKEAIHVNNASNKIIQMITMLQAA